MGQQGSPNTSAFSSRHMAGCQRCHIGAACYLQQSWICGRKPPHPYTTSVAGYRDPTCTLSNTLSSPGRQAHTGTLAAPATGTECTRQSPQGQDRNAKLAWILSVSERQWRCIRWRPLETVQPCHGIVCVSPSLCGSSAWPMVLHGMWLPGQVIQIACHGVCQTPCMESVQISSCLLREYFAFCGH